MRKAVVDVNAGSNAVAMRITVVFRLCIVRNAYRVRFAIPMQSRTGLVASHVTTPT